MTKQSFLAAVVILATVPILAMAESKSASTSIPQKVATKDKTVAASTLRTNAVKLKTSTNLASAASISPSGLESLYGYLEFRPSYISNQGEFHAENTAEVGYKLNPTMKMGYVQWYSNNLKSNLVSTSGVGLIPNDGFFHFKASNIWQSEDKHWSAAYQLRVFAPTTSSKYKAGHYTSFLNRLNIAFKLNDYFKTDLSYAPILHGYSKAGMINSTGVGTANPAFEQQFILNNEFHPAANFTFSLPIVYQVTNNRQFAGAANSDKWKKSLSFWPELDYDINPVHTVGISYYTDNCISSLGNGFDLSNGIRQGVVQLVWGINI